MSARKGAGGGKSSGSGAGKTSSGGAKRTATSKPKTKRPAARTKGASASPSEAARNFGGVRRMGQRLKTATGRTISSQRWLERQLNDPYVAAARAEGWRSRAAFKLIEIDDKHRILKPGQRVLDLGAAPGGWSQVAAQRVRAIDGRGQVVALDYLAFDPIDGVEIVQLDFMDDAAPARLRALLRESGADVVLSDMAAPTMGHKTTDHLRIMALAETALAFAIEVLSPEGSYLCKMLQGGTERELLILLKQKFKTVRHIKPPASRADSAELYVLATGFRGRD